MQPVDFGKRLDTLQRDAMVSHLNTRPDSYLLLQQCKHAWDILSSAAVHPDGVVHHRLRKHSVTPFRTCEVQQRCLDPLTPKLLYIIAEESFITIVVVHMACVLF